jgi:signal-transduction protein with cAMP-binding, CBS, and nucleotidyltransferase domain
VTFAYVLVLALAVCCREEIKVAMESKRPRTRSLLEAEIADAQEKLDDALQRKAYEECGPLQEKLEKLVTQRVDLPTIDELRDQLQQVENEVSEAANRRDFAAAASGQVRIDAAKARLEEAIAAEAVNDEDSEGDGADAAEKAHDFTCRADLEVAISDLQEKVKQAIESKDFSGASSLQSTLDETEKLRATFPSVDELESRLSEAKQCLDEAVDKKDFITAGKMNDEIADLEKKLEEEKNRTSAAEASVAESTRGESTAAASFTRDSGEEVVFTSRVDLEDEISQTSKRVADAVASKQFRKADELQNMVDSLEALRMKLPSLAELETDLKDKQLAMDEAITAKKFAQAEELHNDIEKIETQISTERSRAPAVDASSKSAPIAAASVPLGETKTVNPPTNISMATPKLKRDVRDDVSEVSLSSGIALSRNGMTRSAKTGLSSLGESKLERPVSKLRPKKPLISSSNDSILSMTQMLTNKRGDASLVVDTSGGLAGIITDTDITRRVVAKDIDPSSSTVSVAMTPNPTCVSMSDSAMDALGTMVENHFRHLPVVDDSGAVVGLLDIAKCLNDAISKLERAEEKSSSAAEDAVKQVAGLQGAGGAQAAALQALLGPLMAQAFGNQTSPSLRSLLAGKPATVVSPTTSIRDAGMLMAERRKAALVVEDGQLVGIFGFKDMMSRAVAKELPLELTEVSSVMTPNPEYVSPEMTVLEAMQTMHDARFLTLPVCEDDGRVVGLVDVMDVIYGCGGAEGWRSVFSSAMDIGDDVSDASSVYSHGDGSRVSRSVRSARSSVKKDERPVSKLRPKKPLISSEDDNILSMTQMLANKRGDASLVVNASGGLAGIITDTDITRRVVAKDVDAASSTVSIAMTPNPTCVSMADSAMDALGTMVENHFRHLPVVDESGAVVGLLDIAKCLNDAISKLEHAHEKGSSAAEDAVKQVAGLQGAGGAQAAALQALLGPLMAQAFGNQASPTLRSLLAGKRATIVSPSSSVRDAAMIMAEHRKAALVVEDGQLVGIFGFKDMMTRAVAKELPLDLTEVRSVMTPNPESVSPDITVLEAMQTMHDHRFLTLPVCEIDGRVVGLVDVMDVIYGCGGAEGWRSVFSSAMEVDDASDASSVYSHGDGSRVARSTSSRSVQKKEERPVSKLRPKKPLISSSNDSILSMTQMLTNKRGDASLVVDTSGGLAGIITDTDITRRVVAKDIDPSSSTVSVAMTPNPTCVSMSDSAMDALGTMVENHFRHLPVVDDSGAVVGLLDIAKCLNDAISKLERAEEKSSSAAEDAVKQVAGLQGAGGAQAAALQALLGPLMAQAFGNQTSPSLRSLLAGKPATVVSPTTSIRDAGMLMAERRKAALVVEDGQLVGIFGFKDMMSRAVAKELPLELTEVSSVMTPNPEYVSPEMTVLEAMQTMHDHKFLTLPVCEDDGRVVGLVDVMDVIYGCGGAEGWRSVFQHAIDLEGCSETNSVHSRDSATRSFKSSKSQKKRKADSRPVSKLRPRKPVVASGEDSVLQVSQMLAQARIAAAVVIDSFETVNGIMTDHDVTRRVVAMHKDAATTRIMTVMTPNPTCVSMSESAMDALSLMIENHHRYLPVLDDNGTVSGLLDISKCLNDAISKLEHAQEKSSGAADDAVKQMAMLQGADGVNAAALQALLGPVMAQAFGDKPSPTLRTLLSGKTANVVDPDTSVLETAEKMAEKHKAALVVDNGELVGILSFKDVMTRVIAKELPVEVTAVSSVMTPDPEAVSPDATVLEALQVMHDHNFLTLPVCESDGRVVGVVDVMDLIYGCGGAEGWRSIFDSAMDIEDDGSETQTAKIGTTSSRAPVIQVAPDAPFVSTAVPNNIPLHVEIDEARSDHCSLNESLITDPKGFTSAASPYGSNVGQTAIFKLTDPSGHTHRIRSELSVTSLLGLLVKKMGGRVDAESIHMKFVDDEGDAIMITSDDCLAEAAQLAQKSGSEVVKLSVTVVKPKLAIMEDKTQMAIAGAAAAVAVGAIALFAFKR